jgi:hypothetical protein
MNIVFVHLALSTIDFRILLIYPVPQLKIIGTSKAVLVSMGTLIIHDVWKTKSFKLFHNLNITFLKFHGYYTGNSIKFGDKYPKIWILPMLLESDSHMKKRHSWSWFYGSWIYNYLCNQFLSPLKLWVRIPLMVKCTQYNIMW